MQKKKKKKGKKADVLITKELASLLCSRSIPNEPELDSWQQQRLWVA